jgi:hypothetical protein
MLAGFISLIEKRHHKIIELEFQEQQDYLKLFSEKYFNSI